MSSRQMMTIFLVMFVNMLGFSLILPLLPYYAETFGASETLVGLLVGSYAAAQLIGAPVLGHLSDQYGRRPVLLVSIAGTVASLVMLGFAGALWVMFAARILDGITGGNISVARAYMADITDAQNRSKGLGILGAAFGLGFIMGPALGGILSAGDRYEIPAFAAAGLTFLNLVAVYVYLPESLEKGKRRAASGGIAASVNIRGLLAVFSHPRIGSLLVIRFVFGVAFSILTTIFALFTLKKLGLSATQTGFILTYVGVLLVVVQGIGVGRLSAYFSDEQLILGGIIVITPALFAWGFAPNVPVLLLVMLPVAGAGGVLTTVITSALTKAVPPHEVGNIMGVATAVESLTRAIAPTLGGVLMGLVGTWAPGVFAAFLTAALIYYTWSHLPHTEQPAPSANLDLPHPSHPGD